MTMQTTVLRQLARERQAALRAASLLMRREHATPRMRRWIGRQLVRLGARLANEPTMRPVRAP